MEFEQVVRTRRMVRAFRSDPVAPEMLDGLIDLARRAPSAGHTQGFSFVVFEGPEETAQFWDTTLPVEKRPSFPWPDLLTAPVIVLPCGDANAYVQRYAEADKASTGLGSGPDAWGMEYWHVDTAMATMTLLHAAVAEGLGALFFGLFDNEAAVADLAMLPAGVRPIGAVALGWPAENNRPSKSVGRGRRPLSDVIHRGGLWSSGGDTDD